MMRFGLLSSARASSDTAIDVMTRGWTRSDRFSHAGPYWHFDDIVIEPKPAQSPHPPLWMAAGSDSSVARAAAAGHNLILDQYASPSELGGRIAIYRDHLTARPFDKMNVAVARNVHIADSDAATVAARRRLVASTERILGVSRDPDCPAAGSHVLAYQRVGAVDNYALFGTPGQIVEGLTELHEAGVSYVLLIVESDDEQLRRFREDVIPRLPLTIASTSAGVSSGQTRQGRA